MGIGRRSGNSLEGVEETHSNLIGFDVSCRRTVDYGFSVRCRTGIDSREQRTPTLTRHFTAQGKTKWQAKARLENSQQIRECRRDSFSMRFARLQTVAPEYSFARAAGFSGAIQCVGMSPCVPARE